MITETDQRNGYSIDVSPAGQETMPEFWVMAATAGTPAEVMELRVALHRLADQKAAAQREAAELREALVGSQRHAAELVEQVQDLLRREKALQNDLMQTHERWHRQDVEIWETYGKLRTHRDELEAQCAELHQWLQRVQQSLPGRFFRGLRRMLTLGMR